ncbi:hypothetical protein GQ473_05905 [archaeon]|nr:hypothetical protein [archaeon]
MIENNHIIEESNELLVYAPEKTPRCFEKLLDKYDGRIKEYYFDGINNNGITCAVFDNSEKKEEFQEYLSKPMNSEDQLCIKTHDLKLLKDYEHKFLKYLTYNDALGFKSTTKDTLQLLYDKIHDTFKKEITLKKYPVMIIQSVSMAGLAYASYPTINEPLFIMSFAAMNINLGIYTGYIAHKIHKIKKEIGDRNNFEK